MRLRLSYATFCLVCTWVIFTIIFDQNFAVKCLSTSHVFLFLAPIFVDCGSLGSCAELCECLFLGMARQSSACQLRLEAVAKFCSGFKVNKVVK